jgi:hypothetical protein
MISIKINAEEKRREEKRREEKRREEKGREGKGREGEGRGGEGKEGVPFGGGGRRWVTSATASNKVGMEKYFEARSFTPEICLDINWASMSCRELARRVSTSWGTARQTVARARTAMLHEDIDSLPNPTQQKREQTSKQTNKQTNKLSVNQIYQGINKANSQTHDNRGR